VVQSTAVDFLHLLLVAVHSLFHLMDIKAPLSIDLTPVHVILFLEYLLVFRIQVDPLSFRFFGSSIIRKASTYGSEEEKEFTFFDKANRSLLRSEGLF